MSCVIPEAPCITAEISFTVLSGRAFCPFCFVNVKNWRCDKRVLPFRFPQVTDFLTSSNLSPWVFLKVGILWTEEIAHGILKTEVEVLWLKQESRPGVPNRRTLTEPHAQMGVSLGNTVTHWWHVKLLQPLKLECSLGGSYQNLKIHRWPRSYAFRNKYNYISTM